MLNSRQNISSFQELYRLSAIAVINGSKEKNIPRYPPKRMSTPTLARAMACAHPSPVDIPPYDPRPDKFPPHRPTLRTHAMPTQWKLPTLPPAQEHVGMEHGFMYEINLTLVR